jgi:hypothetical protein
MDSLLEGRRSRRRAAQTNPDRRVSRTSRIRGFPPRVAQSLQIYGQRAFAATAIFDRSEDAEAWLDALERGASER